MARKLFMVAALLAAAAVALAACEGGDDNPPTQTPASGSTFPLTIEQSEGEPLALEQAPQRIISLSSHATEIFCQIGAGDQLAAVEQFANCPPGSKEKPELDAYQPNLEAIVGYGPDLVYIFSDRENIVQALRDLDVPVLYLELPSSLDGVLEQILLFGLITGHEAEAQDLTQSLGARIEAVEEEVTEIEQGPRVFHELDTMYFTVSPDSFVGELYSLLRAENIAAGAVEEYPQLSAEVIIERDPEVIVLTDEPTGVTADSVKERPGWDQISAVKNDRICVIDPDLLSVPGPKVVDGLEALAQCLYPERFS